MSLRIGIDLGGTKIEIVGLGADGAERFRRRIDTPRGSYDGTLRAIADLVAAAETSTGARGTVGIGMPGAVSPATGLVKNANSTWLIGHPLQPDLETILGRPVRLANDANCFALSEASDGAGAGARVVFGVILGTGVGGGIVVDGQPLVRRRMRSRGSGATTVLRWPERGRVARAAVLLRPHRLHRDVPVRTRPGAGLWRWRAGRARDRVGRRRRRRARVGRRRALRAPPRESAGRRDQRARSRRRGARRRALQHRVPLPARAGAVGGLGLLGSRGHAPGPRPARRFERRPRRGVALACDPRASPRTLRLLGVRGRLVRARLGRRSRSSRRLALLQSFIP